MIEKSIVYQIVEEWLKDKDYFIVDVKVNSDDKVEVEIDHADGVWIEDCADLSRFIEDHLDRDTEDYELEVGSAGIGQPFKVLQQYLIHIGSDVEVMTLGGQKIVGVLKAADEQKFTITVQKRIKEEGDKRPKLTDVDETFGYEEIKYTKYLISFK
jgi:ribosome maturation factor RimP